MVSRYIQPCYLVVATIGKWISGANRCQQQTISGPNFARRLVVHRGKVDHTSRSTPENFIAHLAATHHRSSGITGNRRLGGLTRKRTSCAPNVEVASAIIRSAPADRVNALMQAGHQCIRHNANQPWFEFSQQLNKRTPAFDLLITGDVSAHEARIRFCRRHGKPLASDCR